MKHKKSAQWTLDDLQIVLRTLKLNKCRDPQGLLNEIFKPSVAGHDLQNSILSILNKIKDLCMVPEVIQNVNIAIIPKPGKKDLHNISNHRAIFIISILRSIIMKMLLRDEYDMIHSYMSDSSVGGRKGWRAQDHLFIVNGIIHEHAQNVQTNSKTNLYLHI